MCVCSMLSVLFLFFFSSRRRHTRCALVTGVQTCALPILPAAAQSNRPVFYAPDGTPRSLAEVYDRFAAKMGGDTALPAAQPLTADGEGADLPPLPMALARALSGEDAGGGLEEIGRAACRERGGPYV